MKKFLTISLVYAAVMTFGQVGIGISNPTKGAMLEVASNNKGFLPPRMTALQRDAIKPTPEGLIIYNTDLKCLQFWNGTAWKGDECPAAKTGKQALNITNERSTPEKVEESEIVTGS
jgi:hypothetical protein